MRHVSTPFGFLFTLLNQITFNTDYFNFLIACLKGFYGLECAFKCGFCAGAESCNFVDGRCNNGCADGYTGEKCLDGKFIIHRVTMPFSEVYFLRQNP